jgi:hypothetical protein
MFDFPFDTSNISLSGLMTSIILLDVVHLNKTIGWEPLGKIPCLKNFENLG